MLISRLSIFTVTELSLLFFSDSRSCLYRLVVGKGEYVLSTKRLKLATYFSLLLFSLFLKADLLIRSMTPWQPMPATSRRTQEQESTVSGWSKDEQTWMTIKKSSLTHTICLKFTSSPSLSLLLFNMYEVWEVLAAAVGTCFGG